MENQAKAATQRLFSYPAEKEKIALKAKIAYYCSAILAEFQQKKRKTHGNLHPRTIEL